MTSESKNSGKLLRVDLQLLWVDDVINPWSQSCKKFNLPMLPTLLLEDQFVYLQENQFLNAALSHGGWSQSEPPRNPLLQAVLHPSWKPAEFPPRKYIFLKQRISRFFQRVGGRVLFDCDDYLKLSQLQTAENIC